MECLYRKNSLFAFKSFRIHGNVFVSIVQTLSSVADALFEL